MKRFPTFSFLTLLVVLACAHGQEDGKIKYNCLSTNGVTDAVAAFQRLHVLSAAKAGGNLLRDFVNTCYDHDFDDAFYQGQQVEAWNSILTDDLEPPALTAGHIQPLTLHEFVARLPSSNLAVVSHREEITRLKSAINYVVVNQLIAPYMGADHGSLSFSTDFQKKHDFTLSVHDTYAEIDEKGVMAVMKDQVDVIEFDDSRMFTCNAFESIQESKPNLIVMSYNQIDEFQKILAGKYCPHIKDPLPNTQMSKNPSVVLSNGSRQTLNDWIDARINLLEWAMNLRHPGGSCRGELRIMEEALESCPSGFVEVVGSGRVTLDRNP